jgi:hypothetical protein
MWEMFVFEERSGVGSVWDGVVVKEGEDMSLNTGNCDEL